MIRLELQPEIEAQLAAEAHARGLALNEYVESIVVARPVEEPKGHSVAQAIDRILELREGTNLAGLHPRDLINEGRRY